MRREKMKNEKGEKEMGEWPFIYGTTQAPPTFDHVHRVPTPQKEKGTHTIHAYINKKSRISFLNSVLFADLSSEVISESSSQYSFSFYSIPLYSINRIVLIDVDFKVCVIKL
jgi:hypothetical protein